MPQDELTDARPTNYSKWHREKLPRWCYVTNGDWFEQRSIDGKLATIALIETIEVPGGRNTETADKEFPIWQSKKALLENAEKEWNVPTFIVWHNPSCTEFLVQRIGQPPVKMNEQEYRAFLMNLRGSNQ